LKAAVNAIKPERIFAFGGHAHEALLGRRPDQDSIRRGYAYMRDGKTVVYLFKNFEHALYNRFERAELQADMAWAVTADPDLPPWGGVYYLAETLDHAKEAIAAHYAAGKYFTFDLETSGSFRDDGYRLICGAFSPAGAVDFSYLFTEECLLIPEVKALIAKMMVELWPCGHNLQFDLKHIWSWVGLLDNPNRNAPVFQTNIYCDTMWVIRQMDNRCAKALAHAAEIVGMGGHKKRNKEAISGAERELKLRLKEYVESGRKLDALMLLPNKMRKTIHACVRFACDADPKGKSMGMFSHGLVPPDIEYQYCALDTVATSRLVEAWAPLLYASEEERAEDEEAQRMWFQWKEFTEPVIKVAAQMEIWGLPTVPRILNQLKKKVDKVVNKTEAKLKELGFTADKFTTESIQSFLFTQLNFPVLNHKDARTKTGAPSTAAPALKLINDHLKKKTGADDPIISLLEERAAAEKVSSSFTTSIAGRVTTSGLIHHSLLPEGADTGRWSSKDPNCFDGETEILTTFGWVRFDQLRPGLEIGLKVLQVHLEGGKVWSEFVKPIRYVEEPATDWVKLRTRAISMMLTSGHQCPVQARSGVWKRFSAVDYPEDHKQWHCSEHNFTGLLDLSFSESVILCAIQADGHYVPGAIEFSFTKERKITRLREALLSVGARFNEKPEDYRGRIRFRVWTDRSFPKKARKLLGETKEWGTFILDFNNRTARIVESEIFHWDGCITRVNHYSSSDRVSADWIQILQSLCGKKSRLRSYTNENTTRPNWQLDNTTKPFSWTTNVEKTLSHEPDGVAYCVEVPSHNIMVRRDGCVMVTGQTQNLPSHGVWAKLVKRAFKFLHAVRLLSQVDYAAMELRDAAGRAMDEKYAGVFLRGEDPHMGTAKLVWDLERKTEAEKLAHRSDAKCYHPDTEVLVERGGWVSLGRLLKYDKMPKIAVCTPHNLQEGQPRVTMTFEKPTDLFSEYHPSKKLVRFRGDSITADVTPDHGMLVWNKDGEPRKIRADVFSTSYQAQSWAYTAEYRSTDRTRLPECIRDLSDFQLSAIMAVVGTFSSRGKGDRWAKSWTVPLNDGAEDFKDEMDAAGLSYSLKDVAKGKTTKLVLTEASWVFIRKLVTARNFRPKAWWLDLPPEAKRAYFQKAWGLSRGHVHSKTGYRRVICTNKCDAERLHILATTCGYYAEIEERTVANGNLRFDVFLDQLEDGVLKRDPVGTSRSKPAIGEVEYDDEVACVTVSSGYILTRRLGKTLVCGNTINFGILFGKSVYALSKELGKSESETQAIIDEIFGEYERLAEYIEENKRFVAENGCQYTHWWVGDKWVRVNKRYLTGAGSPDRKERSKADRQSTNTDVQGSSALKTTKSAIRVVKRIHEDGLNMQLHNVVHDSLIISTEPAWTLQGCAVVKECMEESQSWIVPTVAEPEVGPSWGELTDVKVLQKYAAMKKVGLDDESICSVLNLCNSGEYKEGLTDSLQEVCELVGML
jgi:DNA polymerase I-like protein with 3'-5' exonuclease and polymerase domains